MDLRILVSSELDNDSADYNSDIICEYLSDWDWDLKNRFLNGFGFRCCTIRFELAPFTPLLIINELGRLSLVGFVDIGHRKCFSFK